MKKRYIHAAPNTHKIVDITKQEFSHKQQTEQAKTCLDNSKNMCYATKLNDITDTEHSF